jgi:hypothetical protein
MANVSVDAAGLRQLGQAMRGADKQIKRELFKAVQRATRPVKEEIKASARATLPSSGGLNEWVAQIGIRTRQAYTGRSVGITITGTLDNKKVARGRGKGRRKAGTFGARADLRAINRGRVMHPAWGRGPLVGPQMVKAGFWDEPLEGLTARRARKEIVEAMQVTADAIAAEVRRAS